MIQRGIYILFVILAAKKTRLLFCKYKMILLLVHWNFVIEPIDILVTSRINTSKTVFLDKNPKKNCDIVAFPSEQNKSVDGNEFLKFFPFLSFKYFALQIFYYTYNDCA